LRIIEEYLERVRQWINPYKKFGAEGLKRKNFSHSIRSILNVINWNEK